MNELLTIFLNNLLPVLLAAGAGYLLAKLTDASPRPLSRVIFYIFSPCLIFTLLTQNNLSDGDILNVLLFTWATTILVGVIAWFVGKAFKLDRQILAAVLLASMFMNAGNFGLSVVLFAFGDLALSFASLFFVATAILAYTVGIIIASTGSASIPQAMLNLLKVPMIYSLFLAIVFMRTQWQVPLPVERTTTLLGNAAIPAMLVLLGMQLKKASWANMITPLAIAGTMRLLVSPIIAMLLAFAFGISGVARQAVVLEAAMPTAVLTTVLATEYEANPSFVTAAVFVTTLVSPITLTPLLAYLGA